MKVCLTCGFEFNGNTWSCPDCGRHPARAGGYLSFAPALAEISDGFPPGAHEHLFQAEQGHFWFQSRNKIVLWSLAQYFANATTFLEIGCGTGFVLYGVHSDFPQIELHGSEVYERALQFAQHRVPGANFYQMDARHIPFSDHFDAIGAFDVLEHVEDDQSVLTEMFKAVKKPGGGIIITVPQHRFLWSVVDEFSCHFRRYSAPELRAKVEKSGFRVVKMTSFMTLTLPLLFSARLRQRRVAVQDFDPLSEFRIPSAVNHVLESVLAFELAAVKFGLKWPIGSSLLLVAKAES